MDVLPDEQTLEIRNAVREFFAAESPTSLVRAAEKNDAQCSLELWRRFTELGWPGVSLPEEHGGQGLPSIYFGTMCEEIGRHIAPVPLYSSIVPAMVLAKFGSTAQREQLKSVASGDRLLAFALQEQGGEWWPDRVATVARRSGMQLLIEGSKYFVDGASIADQCLVLARVIGETGVEEGVALVAVDLSLPGVHVERLVPMAKDSQGIVTLNNVRVWASELVGAPAEWEAAADMLRDLASLTLSCLMAGAARRLMEMAVAYVSDREAFGQPIGAFQAIQHMAADMINGVDGSEMLTREALWLLDQGFPASVEISQAKSFASEKCLMVARMAQQFHGGIGFIAEFDLNLWYRRVASWSLRCGTAAEHRGRIARALLDVPGNIRLGNTQMLPKVPDPLGHGTTA